MNLTLYSSDSIIKTQTSAWFTARMILPKTKNMLCFPGIIWWLDVLPYGEIGRQLNSLCYGICLFGMMVRKRWAEPNGQEVIKAAFVLLGVNLNAPMYSRGSGYFHFAATNGWQMGFNHEERIWFALSWKHSWNCASCPWLWWRSFGRKYGELCDLVCH